MSRSKMLYALQQIDSQLDQHQARLQEIEVSLTDDALILNAQGTAKRAEIKLNNTQKNLQQAEGNVRSQRIKIEQSESSLYSGKVVNPKELQDLQNEIKSLIRFLSMLENRQLESMLALDSAQEIYQDKKEKLLQALDQGKRKNAALIEEKEKLDIEMYQAISERENQWSMIADDDQRKYQTLRKKRAGIAITLISNKACSACGTTLTEVIFRTARSPNQLVSCDTCDRILYAE
jgi:predicted  nucleic acid-binding Zn-ribbon protein